MKEIGKVPMNNKTTKYFILGLATGFVAIPLIEELMTVVNTWIQALLIKPNKIVIKGNKELAELQGDEEEIQTHCIGFQVPSSNDYEDDDYDE